ncbi:MAG: hypothetical protein AAGC44_05190 [Planctomycetota bacterium]
MSIGTGHGTTIAFGTSGFTALFRAMDFGDMDRGEHDSSHLETVDFRTFIPGDLTNPGELDCTMLYDPDTSTLPPLNADPETITLTYKTPSGKSTGPTFACSGFIKGFRPGQINSDGMQEAKAKIKWSGTPTLTAGTV